MSLPRRILPWLAALPLALAACGDSGPDPESDAKKTPAQVQAQAEAATPETLEESVEIYTAAVASLEATLAELENELRALPPGDILGAKGTSLSAEAERVRNEHVRLKRNLAIYTEELAHKR